jgi:hypothetical protein
LGKITAMVVGVRIVLGVTSMFYAFIWSGLTQWVNFFQNLFSVITQICTFHYMQNLP